jgi:ubiquinone/menaquinone biosynthesis C-methylase UbiE
MIDLSEAGVRAARVRNPEVQSLRMDGEALAFSDQAFDRLLVRDGLHHLARPLLTSPSGRRYLGMLFRFVQAVVGRWGNSLIVVAWKKSAAETPATRGSGDFQRPGRGPERPGTS